jgi:hypothetical protein
MWLKAEGNLVRGKENTGKFRKIQEDEKSNCLKISF